MNPWPTRPKPDGIAWCCGMLWLSLWFRVFDIWSHTHCNHPFVYLTPFNDPLWWTKSIKFWFICLQLCNGSVSWPRLASLSCFDIFEMAFLLSSSQTCSSKSSFHCWTRDLLSMITIKLCLKLLFCEPPIIEAVNSQKLVNWFSCGFASARPLPVRVCPSFWHPLDGKGNYTDGLTFFAVSLSERRTFLSVMMVCLYSTFSCLCLSPFLLQQSTFYSTALFNWCSRGFDTTVCSHAVFMLTEGL